MAKECNLSFIGEHLDHTYVYLHDTSINSNEQSNPIGPHDFGKPRTPSLPMEDANYLFVKYPSMIKLEL